MHFFSAELSSIYTIFKEGNSIDIGKSETQTENAEEWRNAIDTHCHLLVQNEINSKITSRNDVRADLDNKAHFI